ncbi:hypothetical protein [Pseudomonas sp. PSE14]|uniref:hypothetical protein n=1 Tax=Pseudomonas sp. PSE14 TaxID=3016341 RepID=UPI0023D7F68E|nr:hypothetical protein [Pseudomonas sp. PSE14]WEJ70449.1 hypothetical protein O6P39_17430 [Pseudomonas sp. PSE14]
MDAYRACLQMPAGVDVCKALHHLRDYLRYNNLGNPEYKWIKSQDGSTFVSLKASRDIILRLSISKLEERGATVVARLQRDIIKVMKNVIPLGAVQGKHSANRSRKTIEVS